MVKGQGSFPEFERLLEKERPLVYHEEYDHFSELSVGLLLVSVGITLFIIMESVSNFIHDISLLLPPIGAILCCRGLILNRLGRREYQFRGLSRTALSETVMYLDSKVAQPEELESIAPYHEGSTLSSFEQIKMQDALVRFVKNTIVVVTWPTGFILDIKGKMEKIKKRLAILPICVALLTLLLFAATYNALTSESQILVFFAWSLGYLLLISFGCIAQSLYYYARSPILGQSSRIITSGSQKIEDTLNEILALLHNEYNYPLRFYVAGAYPILEYTGRTKTSYSLVRLKEAVFYPRIHNV
jgi:hypothetical protein